MNAVYAEIEKILEEFVRPVLRDHGGDVSIADIKDGVLHVRLTGHCSHCPSAMYTLESIVKEEVLKNTNAVQDVVLQEEVSQELLDFAKNLMGKRNK